MPNTPRLTEPLPAGATAEDLDDVMTPDMTDEEAARVRPIREAPASLLAALSGNLLHGGKDRPRIDPHAPAAEATGPSGRKRMGAVLSAEGPWREGGRSPRTGGAVSRGLLFPSGDVVRRSHDLRPTDLGNATVSAHHISVPLSLMAFRSEHHAER